MNPQEFIDYHAANGISRSYLNWFISYCKAGQLDTQTIDIQATYDKALTIKENKDIIRTRYPISNMEKLAQEQASKAQQEHLNNTANAQYVQEVKAHESEVIAQIRTQPDTNYINKYTNTLKALVKNVANGYNTSLFVISDEVGIGKTHTVLTVLNELNYTSGIDYELFNGYTTPLSVYEFLYTNRDKKLIVFDDIDNCYKNNTIINFFKAATFNATGERKLQYLTTSKNKTAPDEFILKANLIFISNELPNNTMVKALTDRALYLKLELNNSEKKRLLADFIKIPYKNTTAEQRSEVLDFLLTQNTDAIKNLNYRTMQKLYNLALEGSLLGQNWQTLGAEILQYDDELLAFMESEKESTTKAAIEKFEELTGLGRRSYFRTKKKYYTKIISGQD